MYNQNKNDERCFVTFKREKKRLCKEKMGGGGRWERGQRENALYK